MTGELVYSPGYQLTLWLGAGQVRLWRQVDRMLGSRSSSEATVRAIAARAGANPGQVSRDLRRLASLGFIARSTTRGRTGGVRLWRVVSRRIRGLAPARHARALRRMGVPVPGQLTLAEASGPRPWWDTEPDELAPAEPGSLRAERDPVTPELVDELEPSEHGPYGMERCGCGRLRLTVYGDVAGPCPHER